MTKSELIERISEQLNLPNGKAELIVNCVFNSMIRALRQGEGIEIRGFGSFTVRQYKSYDGRNPRTGEAVHVAPKRLPFFKVGKDLRERVDAGPPEPAPSPEPPSLRSVPLGSPPLGSNDTTSDQGLERATPIPVAAVREHAHAHAHARLSSSSGTADASSGDESDDDTATSHRPGYELGDGSPASH